MDTSLDQSSRPQGRPTPPRERLRRTPIGSAVATATRRHRSYRALQRSGLFDEAWYRAQTGPGPGPHDPIAHYLRVGADLGLSPHPLFDPAHYLEHSVLAQRSAAAPFVEFVNRGCHRGDDPHPLFSTAAYLDQVPEAARHPYGAFGHFLASDDAPWPIANMVGGDTAPRGRDRYLRLVRAAVDRHRTVEDHTDFPRSFETFDHDAADEFVAAMRDVVADMAHRPTVSVVIPTKDRRDTVAEAIRSVRAQTYPHWELVVVDDGGTDGTDDLVRELAADDDRIRYVHQANTGVAGARNHGIRTTTGELVAYLDSDNTWVPEFLETMVGYLHDRGFRAAYAASELRSGDRVEYRGQPLHVGALRERNYIDCITIVHDRGLVDDLGGRVFDDRLRRVVDWDLLIRLSEVTDLGYAPFIATRYDVWDDATDRITNTENPAYRQVVLDKHLVDWEDLPEPTAGRVSVVLVVRGPGDRTVPQAARAIDALLAPPMENVEVLVVDDGLEPAHAVTLRVFEQLSEHVRVQRVPDPVSTIVARNLAASAATGEVLLFLDPCVHLEADDARRLVEAVREQGALLAQPLVLGTDGLVYSTGQVLGPHTSEVTVGRGLAPEDPALATEADRDGVDGLVFAVDAPTYRHLHGMDPLYLRGAADLDLGLRARTELGTPTRFVGEAGARLSSPEDVARWSPSEHDRVEFAHRWREHPARDLSGLDDDTQAVEGLAPMPGESRGFPKRWTAQVRPRHARRRWAIKTSVPDVEARQAWGDWHFACSLRDALIELGEDAVIDCRPAWSRPTARYDDINLVLRGTQRFEPPPDKRNLLWVISHPERLTRYELEQFDEVFVASPTYPDDLARRWPGVTARPLLQCTDPGRFHPDPDPALHEDLLFVGNSRNILRRVVHDALEAGLEPAVYGAMWEELIPRELVKGTYLPNEALRRHYASAGVVLNDHWDDMRDGGFLSNRLFDAVASGARVVTDDVAGLDGIFGDRVVTYDGGPEALAAAVEEARARPIGNPDVVARIAAEHTFLARARTLVEAADRLSDPDAAGGAAGRERIEAVVDEPRPAASVREPEPAVSEVDSVEAGEVPPVFVGGTGRSGTTIVGDMIAASHRYTAVPVEIRLHTDPGGLPDLIAGRIGVDVFAEHVESNWYIRRANNNGPRGLHVIACWDEVQRALDRLREGAEADVAAAAGQFLRDLLDPLAAREGAASWVETTPPSARAAGPLAQALPTARFINMVRDGRDVATSVVQRGWGPDTMPEALAWWAEQMIAISRSTAHLADHQVLHLRLESLVGPERDKAFRQVSEFLGIDEDPDMRAFFDEHLTSDRAREGRWRRGRSREEIVEIERGYQGALARLAAEGVELPPV